MFSDNSWVTDVPERVFNFLHSIEKPNRPGAFTYTMSGDSYDISSIDHLGSIVYALKILYTIRQENSLLSQNAFSRLKRFQSSSGDFSDPLVTSFYQKGWRRRIFRKKYKDNLSKYILAETRQSYSASLLVNDKLDLYKFDSIPKSVEGLWQFLEDLDWRNPWNAGAQFSHLMFFYSLLNSKSDESFDFRLLQKEAVKWIFNVYKSCDGLWYSGDPSIKCKINGAMKILTGLDYFDEVPSKLNFEKLAQSCLDNYGQDHACDLLNHILVLSHCFENVDNDFLRDKIREAAEKWLVCAEKYYCKDYGGFFFNKDSPNLVYYGSSIAKNDHRPDIHATVLFTWGIALAVTIIDSKNNMYRVFKT